MDGVNENIYHSPAAIVALVVLPLPTVTNMLPGKLPAVPEFM